MAKFMDTKEYAYLLEVVEGRNTLIENINFEPLSAAYAEWIAKRDTISGNESWNKRQYLKGLVKDKVIVELAPKIIDKKAFNEWSEGIKKNTKQKPIEEPSPSKTKDYTVKEKEPVAEVVKKEEDPKYTGAGKERQYVREDIQQFLDCLTEMDEAQKAGEPEHRLEAKLTKACAMADYAMASMRSFKAIKSYD